MKVCMFSHYGVCRLKQIKYVLRLPKEDQEAVLELMRKKMAMENLTRVIRYWSDGDDGDNNNDDEEGGGGKRESASSSSAPNTEHQHLQSQLQCSLSFDIDAANQQLVIHSQNVNRCNVSFYGMNTELLFSINPFTFIVAADKNGGGGSRSSNHNENATNYISPRIVTKVEVQDDTSTTVRIPSILRNENVFIRIDSCDDADAVNQVSESDTFYDHQLVLYVKERYGQIQVLSAKERKPIPKAYCKVFAKMSSGSQRHEFYKDGYTDIRGTFDYVTVSSGKLQNVQKFAILIVTDNQGSAIKYAKPPKR